MIKNVKGIFVALVTVSFIFLSFVGKDTPTEGLTIGDKAPELKIYGGKQMGKSLGNAIYLSDSDEVIHKKVMGALTDPGRIKKDDPGNPDICMVAYYHNLFSKREVEKVCEECKAGARGCVACKKQLIQNIIKEFKPLRERRKYYEERPEELKKILMEGTEKARQEAKLTMKKVKEAMKLDY